MKEKVLNNFKKELSILLRQLPDESIVYRGEIEGEDDFIPESFLTFSVKKTCNIGEYMLNYYPYLFKSPDYKRIQEEPFYRRCYTLLVPMPMKRLIYFILMTGKIHGYRFKKFGFGKDIDLLQTAVNIIKNNIGD